MVFKIPPKITNHLGYFCNKICCQEITKIAQSDHTTKNKKFQGKIQLLCLERFRKMKKSVGRSAAFGFCKKFQFLPKFFVQTPTKYAQISW